MLNAKKLSRCLLVAVALATVASIGCGDFVSNQGNLGKLTYALHTDYMVVDETLDAVKLITGVEHRVMVTPGGEDDISDPASIQHVMAPATDVTITTDVATTTIGDAVFTVEKPGTYTLQSWQGTELIDYIVLNFVDADGLDLITFVLEPGDDEFQTREGDTITAELFSQATFIGKPVDADGNTLVGNINMEFHASPEDAAVAVRNLDAVYENGVWDDASPINMLFVEPGNVTVILTESLTGLQKTVDFVITDPAAE